MLNGPTLRFALVQAFAAADVATRWVDSGRRVVPEVERKIEAAWQATIARPGVRLFDGPICRFEAARVDGGRLTIDLSRTSYRVFVGTNFAHPEFADDYGVDVMANGLGVSTGLLTADGHWVMGRRNRSVAYYPGRVHPFAGSIEVTERVDLFDNVRRELREELRLSDDAVPEVRLLGLAEDRALRHPEAVFFARTTLTRDAVLRGLDADEHDAGWSTPNTPAGLETALTDPQLTPVARAVLLLGGRHALGDAWFAAASASLGIAATMTP